MLKQKRVSKPVLISMSVAVLLAIVMLVFLDIHYKPAQTLRVPCLVLLSIAVLGSGYMQLRNMQ